MNRKQWAMKGKDCRKKADGMNILCAICLGERRVWGRFCFKLWRACMGWLFVLVWAGCLGEIRWLCQKERVDCPTCDHYARRRVELFHGVNRSCPRLARDMNVADVCLGIGNFLVNQSILEVPRQEIFGEIAQQAERPRDFCEQLDSVRCYM